MSYARAEDLAAVRAFVCARALAGGLSPARVDLLGLAVSELATNTLQHTEGGGLVRVWTAADDVICDIVDQGGLRSVAGEMPAADAIRGRGLAIVARICDEVTVSASPQGTVVRVRFHR
ncbi:ATP-binding protein [Micromonospora sp. HSS6-12]|uniref:ATP-binding protein n=2 Tax=Micromonospora thermarum TaxID=2720024 RepID=A0ABX0Z6T4_9ACTN|nr:ATP-binding protein [Micromonospora thermarum]